MKQVFKVGDTVRCISANSGSKLTVGKVYTVLKVSSRQTTIAVEGIHGTFFSERFELVPPAPKKPHRYGVIKAIKVDEQDVLMALTAYVQLSLGINASVGKIIQKFGEAVELELLERAA
ncbi:hypothetical protein GOC72_18835 [Sinorhizobium medicae]|nr:hypothetical protein [Sinorhizobium medicae]